jgi:ribosomal-protein-alanine N-acetyltransferase
MPRIRIYLTNPTEDDADEFVKVTLASRKLHRPWLVAPTTPAAYARFLERSRRTDYSSFLVRRVADDALAGSFTLSNIVRGYLQSAYLSYWAAASLAGNGYMSEGLGLVAREAFTTLKLHRLEANIQPGNSLSIALVRRAGFTREGFSPRYLKVLGRWRDHERWALLADEWREARSRG